MTLYYILNTKTNQKVSPFMMVLEQAEAMCNSLIIKHPSLAGHLQVECKN